MRFQFQNYIKSHIEDIKKLYKRNLDSKTYLKSFNLLKDYRDSFLKQLNQFIISNKSEKLGDDLSKLFENLFNTLYNTDTFSKEGEPCRIEDIKIFKEYTCELFVFTISILIRNELFLTVNKLLCHAYKLNEIPCNGSPQKKYTYGVLRESFSTLDDTIIRDKELSKKYGSASNYIYNERQCSSIFLKNDFIQSDLFLSQVYYSFDFSNHDINDRWIPTFYLSVGNNDYFWKQLRSQTFCNKIMPLFNVNTIDDLKEIIKESTIEDPEIYPRRPNEKPKSISTIIVPEDIGTLP